MIFDITPPIVSMPSDSGVTSSSSISRRPLIEDVGLHGGAERHDFVGVQIRSGSRPNSSSTHAPHERDPRRAADQHHLVDVVGARPASASACRQGPSVRSTSGMISALEVARG